MKAVIRPTSSPVQLERHFLKSLHFEMSSGFDRALGSIPRSELVMPEIDIGVVAVDSDPDNPRKWRFEVAIDLPAPVKGKFPYRVSISMVGLFSVADNYPSEGINRLITTNGPSLIYSAAREILAIITACSPYPPILIPAVSFAPEEVNAAAKLIGTSKAKTARKKATKRVKKKK